MQITYELTERDFVEAYSKHRDRSPLSKWSRRLFVSMIVLITVLFVAGAVANPSQRAAKSVLPFIGLLVFWIALLWVIPNWSMRRQFLKQPGAQGPRSVTFDSNGAHWRWNGGSGDIAWKNYIRWVEGKRQILFYTSPACFNILPKHHLQPEQVTEVRDVLNQNIHAPK